MLRRLAAGPVPPENFVFAGAGTRRQRWPLSHNALTLCIDPASWVLSANELSESFRPILAGLSWKRLIDTQMIDTQIGRTDGSRPRRST